MGLPPVSMAQAQKATGPSHDIFAQIILGEANRSRSNEFFKTFRPIYEKQCYQKTRPFVGIPEVVQKLENISLAVASNKMLSMTKMILQKLQMAKYFDLVVGPELVQQPKPAADMIEYTLKALRISPDRALVIGDTDNDILAAQAAGVKSCFVAWGYADTENDLRQASDFYAAKPKDILTLISKELG